MTLFYLLIFLERLREYEKVKSSLYVVYFFVFFLIASRPLLSSCDNKTIFQIHKNFLVFTLELRVFCKFIFVFQTLKTYLMLVCHQYSIGEFVTFEKSKK